MDNGRFGLRLTVALGLLGFLAALIYAWQTPPWQAPDEPSHLGYINHIDQTRSLPSPFKSKIPKSVQSKARDILHWPKISEPLPDTQEVLPAEEFAYRDLIYTANHPPLYYFAAWPFARIGASLAGNRLSGLAYGARVFSSLLVGVTVALGFLCAIAIGLPRSQAVVVSLLLILQPQYLFIGSSINNDSLTVCLWTAFVYIMLREIKESNPVNLLAAGTVLGLGLLTKVTFFLALPLLWLGIALAGGRHRRPFWLRSLVSTAVALLVSSWWFIGNLSRYGKPWYVIGGKGLGPTTFSEFFTVSQFYQWVFKSYWGYFGWMNRPLPPIFFSVLIVLIPASLAGVVIALTRSRSAVFRRSLIFLIGNSVTLLIGVVWFRIVAHTGQGRYLFPAIVPATILLLVGIENLVPVRLRLGAACAVVAFFAVMSGFGLSLSAKVI